MDLFKFTNIWTNKFEEGKCWIRELWSEFQCRLRLNPELKMKMHNVKIKGSWNVFQFWLSCLFAIYFCTVTMIGRNNCRAKWRCNETWLGPNSTQCVMTRTAGMVISIRFCPNHHRHHHMVMTIDQDPCHNHYHHRDYYLLPAFISITSAIGFTLKLRLS